MRKYIKTLGIIFLIIFATSCSPKTDFQNENSKKPNAEAKEYITINYTTYNDNKGPENGMSLNILAYDCKLEKLEQIAKLPYTSQYPLSVYYESDNAVYFSGKSENSKKGDQLLKLDLKTQEITQLTDDLFAINYIVPRTKDILLVAVKSGDQALRLIRYDKVSGDLEYKDFSNDNWDIWSIGLDTEDENIFYTASYNIDESYDNAELQSIGINDRYKYADNILTKYDTKENITKRLFLFKAENINDINARGNNLLLLRDLELNNPSKQHYSLIDLERETIEDLILPKDEFTIKSIKLSDEENTVYFLANNLKTDERGIYKYNLSTKDIKDIFIEDSNIGHINNFELIKN